MDDSPFIDHLARWAHACPDKPAVRLVDNDTVRTLTYRELHERARRLARWLVDLGLSQGDVFASWMENRLAAVALTRAARRAGLYYTAVGARSSRQATAYLLDDSGARSLHTTRPTA